MVIYIVSLLMVQLGGGKGLFLNIYVLLKQHFLSEPWLFSCLLHSEARTLRPPPLPPSKLDLGPSVLLLHPVEKRPMQGCI